MHSSRKQALAVSSAHREAFESDGYVPGRKSPQAGSFGGRLQPYLQHCETVRFDPAGWALASGPSRRRGLWSCCRRRCRRACSSAARRRGWSLPARCAAAVCWIPSRTRTAAGWRRGVPRLPRWGSPRSRLGDGAGCADGLNLERWQLIDRRSTVNESLNQLTYISRN